MKIKKKNIKGVSAEGLEELENKIELATVQGTDLLENVEQKIRKKKRPKVSFGLGQLFRFSLTFKITFVYAMLFSFLLFLISLGFYFGLKGLLTWDALKDETSRQLLLDIILGLLILLNTISVFICIGIGARVSKNILKPIAVMTDTVKEITVNELDKRLDIKGSQDELRDLAVTFNEMIDRIQASYEKQNQFTSDASHELRTPISVIQGYINMLDRWGKEDTEILAESISAIKSESENMKGLTETLLFLAKADKDMIQLEFTDFDIHELVDEIIKETRMIDSNHTVGTNINENCNVYADRDTLKQAIRVFMDNSIKYTQSGGEVFLDAYEAKGFLYVVISDNGVGISKEDINRVFDRFYRADKSRTKASGGHGLGLSIAKWVVARHNGRIEVRSQLGKGTKVTLKIPLKIDENTGIDN